jgi:hypothetical protein
LSFMGYYLLHLALLTLVSEIRNRECSFNSASEILRAKCSSIKENFSRMEDESFER